MSVERDPALRATRGTRRFARVLPWSAALLLASCADVQPTAPQAEVHASEVRATPGGPISAEERDLATQLADRFFEPEAHLELAKRFLDRGARLRAFFVVDAARGSFVDLGYRPLFDREGRRQDPQPRPLPEFHRAMARILHGREPLDTSPEAETRLLELHDAEPASVDPLVRLGDLYAGRGDWKQARVHLEAAVALNADDAEAVRALATATAMDGDRPRAQRLFDEYARTHPESKISYESRVASVKRSDPSEAERILREATAKYPDDARLLFDLAALVQERGDLDTAERLFLEAAARGRDSAEIQSWVGRFFLRVRNDEKRSLEYYLNAYFLDPDVYDSEHASTRIPRLGESLSAVRFAKLRGSRNLAEIASDDDPTVVWRALEAMHGDWSPAFVPVLYEPLRHECASVRMTAVAMLAEKLGASGDAEIDRFLTGDDPWLRGAAAYIVAQRDAANGVARVRPLLDSPSQLVRFDAVSALVIHGGPRGRELARAHLASATHPYIKRLAAKLDAD